MKWDERNLYWRVICAALYYTQAGLASTQGRQWVEGGWVHQRLMIGCQSCNSYGFDMHRGGSCPRRWLRPDDWLSTTTRWCSHPDPESSRQCKQHSWNFYHVSPQALLQRNCGCLSSLNVVKSISCATSSTCSSASATAGTPVDASGRMVHSACAASSSRWKLWLPVKGRPDCAEGVLRLSGGGGLAGRWPPLGKVYRRSLAHSAGCFTFMCAAANTPSMTLLSDAALNCDKSGLQSHHSGRTLHLLWCGAHNKVCITHCVSLMHILHLPGIRFSQMLYQHKSVQWGYVQILVYKRWEKMTQQQSSGGRRGLRGAN